MTFFYNLNKKLDEIRATPEVTHKQLNERDEGKPGKNFAKIAKDAGERYGSKAAGERVAGAVRNKLKDQGKLEEEGMHSKDAMELNPDFAKVGKKPGMMGKLAQGVKKVADFVAPGDEDLMRDLERKSGGRRPTKEAAAPIDFDKVLDAIAALYGDDIWENDAMQDLANDLEQAGPTDRELDFIIAKGKLPKRLAGTQFSAGDNVRFGEAAAPMSAKQKSFAALAEPKDKITFADKIAGAKKEVDEMLGDVAAEAMKNALGKGKQPTMGEATKEIPGGRRHTSEPGGYGRKDDDAAPAVQTKRGRGRPKTGADSDTGEVMKPDWSAFGVGKVKLPAHKGAVTKHKMVGEDESADVEAAIKMLKKAGYTVSKDDEEQVNEKAVSKKQQKFMGMVHAAQKGEKPASKEVAKVAKSMGKKDAEDFAATKHKGLPEKVKKTAKKDKEDKVDETTTSGSVATAPTSGKKSSGGFNFGGGIYDSINRELENMIAESMSINMSMSNDGNGPNRTLTVTATDEDATQLAQLLKSAGLGGGDSEGYGGSGYQSSCGCGTPNCSCGDQEMDEAYGDTQPTLNEPDYPTNTESAEDNFEYSGGLNKPKSTGQTTIPVIASQDDRQHSYAEAEEDDIKRMMEMAGIKKKPVDEEKTEEGNKFTGNLAKARADGKKEADLDGDGDMEKVQESIFDLTNQWKAYKG